MPKKPKQQHGKIATFKALIGYQIIFVMEHCFNFITKKIQLIFNFTKRGLKKTKIVEIDLMDFCEVKVNADSCKIKNIAKNCAPN